MNEGFGKTLLLPVMIVMVPLGFVSGILYQIGVTVYAVLLAGVLYRILSRRIGSDKKMIIGAIVFTVLPIAIDTVTMEPWCGGHLTTSGFEAIKPQLAATNIFSDGRFQLVMTNGAGADIHVLSANASEKESSGFCTLILNTSTSPNPIHPGDNFLLEGSQCHSLEEGDMSQFNVTVTYTLTLEGTTTTRTEHGTIRGPVE